ncbi:DUF6898 family protein [Polycladidibacter stylochi]|uniref:DUF6898 family protein n=1 Tax=Polycladidibacter stylochi TaxID=1807766 RepID=UPI0009E87955
MSPSQTREVFFEVRQYGALLKVSAICSQSGTEVFVSGPKSASLAYLKNLAYNKLLLELKAR